MTKYRGLRRRTIWIAVSILVCLIRVLAAEPSSGKTLSVLNLRDYGWQSPDPIHPHETDTTTSRSIAIDHLGRILVGFPVRERGGLATRERPALSFKVVRFSPDGKVDLSLSLPANGWRNNSLYLSERDQVIVRANTDLQLLQSDSWQVGNENPRWTTILPCGSNCRVAQSPSRRTFLIYDLDPSVAVIDTFRLPTVERCSKPHDETYLITDTYAYFTEQTRQLDLLTYRWPLCDYERRVEMPLHIRGRFTVLNDQLFIADADAFVTNATHPDKDSNRTLIVMSLDNHVKFRQKMGSHELWDNFWVPIQISERGNRIAVDVITERGGSETLDISSHMTARRIAVYDINAGKELASIPVSPKHRYRYEFDLSPDGRRLAVLEDDTVRVVDLEEKRP
jgi:hypothetical protein